MDSFKTIIKNIEEMATHSASIRVGATGVVSQRSKQYIRNGYNCDDHIIIYATTKNVVKAEQKLLDIQFNKCSSHKNIQSKSNYSKNKECEVYVIVNRKQLIKSKK
jgi:hypothetical protein